MIQNSIKRYSIILTLALILFAQKPHTSGADGQLQRTRPEEGVALLARGPYEERGLVFISTNVIDYRAGEYRFHQGDVTVVFPSRMVFLDDSWQGASCGTVDALLKDINEAFLKSSVAERVYMVDREGEQIFFHFRGTVLGDECPFIERFLLRYDWFSRISKEPGRLSLPAVVQWAD